MRIATVLTATAFFHLITTTLAVECEFKTIPHTPLGVFNASACLEINGSLDTAWKIILDFPKYPDWNPFVRSQYVVDTLGIPLPDQTPHEGSQIQINSQVPPLSPPVNSSSPSNPLHSLTSYENITVLDTELHRAAWKLVIELPGAELLNATHWQALTDLGEGKMLYESLEIYYAPLSWVLDLIWAEGLQEGFDAQAEALRERIEWGW